PARCRGRVAGGAALAVGPGVLRAGPARRPAAQEDRGGGHGALPGARDVGAAEAGGHLAGERGPGRVAAGGMEEASSVRGHEVVRVTRGGRRSFAATPSAGSEGGSRRKNAWQAGRGERSGRLGLVSSQDS